MTDNWEQFVIQQFRVAITVANHESISDVQLGLQFFPSFFVELRGTAFTLQIAFKGREFDCCVDVVALGL